ncbi:hypothetical protein GCM10023210_23290 [Chryseobacterium ginsengisoli]|uniref:Glycosyltransferase 2-like domain-containing protein n=1 Tax=Chryseobacterium ginsengisoli TaxID=363853 RepID=A0ABP9M932_9FLAO
MDSGMLSDKNKLTVAVYMITYNQENFIEQSVESVVNQKTNFNYKLFIGEDCSTDRTREICIQLKEKYPDKIHLALNESNLGASLNAKNTFNLSFGSNADYIALIEGDDYWTDPFKLQKQVDFLENNPEYSSCFHNVEEVDSSGKPLENRLVVSETVEKTYTIEDLANGNFIHTAAVVFRRNFNEIPAWVFNSPAGDYPIHMINASYGFIKYFPQKMAAYRIGQGIWSSQAKQIQFINTIFVIKLMMVNLKLSQIAIKNFNDQLNRLVLHIKEVDIIPIQDPEKAAYNLPFKKLIIILLRKIRYNF